MKKSLLSLAVLLLTSTWASAQIKTLVPKGITFEHKSDVKTEFKSVKKTAPKKALAENQTYLGPYTTDDLASTKEGLGIPSLPGTIKVGAMLDKTMLAPYKGAKIVGIRVGLCDAADGVVAFAAPVGNGLGKNIFEQEISSTKVGWNEVNVTSDYTIGTDDALLIGFSYKQTSSNYPISTNSKVAYDGCFYCYANLGSGLGWYNMGTDYGSVSVQLIVEKDGGFSKLDGKIEDLYVPKFVKGNETMVYFSGSTNLGATFSSAEYGVKLNGTEIKTFDNTSAETEKKVDVTSVSQYFGGVITLPAANLKAVGEENELTVYIKSVNGQTPENTDDDVLTTKFKIFADSLSHQKQLIEHFTSQYCSACPYGITILETLTKQRSDIAWVSLHGNMSTGNDIYTISDASTYMNYATTGYPTATFNRYYLAPVYGGTNDGNLSFGLGYNTTYATQVAKMFSTVIDYSNKEIPAFTTVDIATTYDETTKTLGIKVSGEGVDNVQKLLGEDAVVTVYLTEDGLVAKQNNNGTYNYKFTHNNVLRKIVSAPLGDAVVWNGNKFEKDYEVTLDKAWTADNMHVVAFISSPLKVSDTYASAYDEVWVNNANSVKLSDATGINNAISSDKAATEVARYSLDGVQLSAPQKGLNIVKMSDGSTMKVMVK